MDRLSAYERAQVGAIAAWKAEEPGVVRKAIGVVTAPAAWLVQRVVPEAAVRGALDGANWVAEKCTDKGDVLRDSGVAAIRDLRTRDLELSDRLSDSVHNWAVGIAIAEGGGTGTLGLPGIALDVPAVIALALRTVHKVGLCYGYEASTPEDRQFVYAVLSASGANSVQEKLAALTTLRSIEVMVAKETWKAMAGRAAQQPLSREAGVTAIKNLAKQLGVNLTKRKTLQAIPIIGAAVGGSANGWWLKEVGWAARRSFQERWLRDNGKWPGTQPTLSEAPPPPPA